MGWYGVISLPRVHVTPEGDLFYFFSEFLRAYKSLKVTGILTSFTFFMYFYSFGHGLKIKYMLSTISNYEFFVNLPCLRKHKFPPSIEAAYAF